MGTSPSRLSYSDCFELMDAAIEDARGKRVKVRSKGEGNHLRVRLHTARNIDRKDNASTYPEDHPLHGRSTYDSLTVTIQSDKFGTWWVYLERSDTKIHEAESLSVVPIEPAPEMALPEPVAEPKVPLMNVVQGLMRRKL